MNIVYISGSPRKKSNTDFLLTHISQQTGGEFIKLSDYAVKPCSSCWACLKHGSCIIEDDMTAILLPKILRSDTLVIGTPVFFNNVTAQLKSFIDRTWSIKGLLKNKIGASVVVGRRDGAEGAITAIHAFFLKHEMIIANRGITGTAYRAGEIANDAESLQAADRLASRILELYEVLNAKNAGSDS